MNNSDSPAMAITVKPTEQQKLQAASSICPINETYHLGLTKREYFAGLAMQGLLTANDNDGEWSGCDAAAEQAVIEADALLKQLDKNL